MNKGFLFIIICFLVAILLVTCKKSPIISEVDDQPTTITIEINGQQSHEVRVK